MFRTDFTGNVGKDAIHREGKNGDKYCAFSVAIKTGSDTTQWADCLKKDPDNKFLPMIKKGAKIFVSGKPRFGHYITTESKEIVDTLSVFVDFFELLDKKPEQTEANPSQEGRVFPERHEQNPASTVGADDSEDLPF